MLKHESLRRDKAEIRQRLVSNSHSTVEQQIYPVNEPTNRSNKIGEHDFYGENFMIKILTLCIDSEINYVMRYA